MTLRLQLVNLSWDGVSGSSGYDILLDGVKVSNTGSKARTTKITIPEGAEHLVTIKAQPSGQLQEARFEWSSGSAPPPPPPSGAYLSEDWNSGKIGPPWTNVFYPGSPGYVDLTQNAPVSASPDGRVSVVPNPYGPGKVVRCEIRNSDPGWGPNTALHKAEVRTDVAQTFNGPFAMGDVIWMLHEFVLPDEFALATGGSNAFTDIGPELHNSGSTKWPTISVVSYPGSTINLQLDGGDGSKAERPALFPLDAAHRNRMIELVIGAKLTDQNDGWVEAYVDRQLVVSRPGRPTVWPGENGPYYKYGLYKERASSFPNGGAVIYHGATYIGTTKASVGV